jgi:hypothetical protein
MTPLSLAASIAIGLAVHMVMPDASIEKRCIVAMTISALWGVFAIRTGVIT